MATAVPSSYSDVSPDICTARLGHLALPVGRATLGAVSNAAGAQTSREEEIAFLALEQVLEVDIKLADAGAGERCLTALGAMPTDAAASSRSPHLRRRA